MKEEANVSDSVDKRGYPGRSCLDLPSCVCDAYESSNLFYLASLTMLGRSSFQRSAFTIISFVHFLCPLPSCHSSSFFVQRRRANAQSGFNTLFDGLFVYLFTQRVGSKFKLGIIAAFFASFSCTGRIGVFTSSPPDNRYNSHPLCLYAWPDIPFSCARRDPENEAKRGLTKRNAPFPSDLCHSL